MISIDSRYCWKRDRARACLEWVAGSTPAFVADSEVVRSARKLFLLEEDTF